MKKNINKYFLAVITLLLSTSLLAHGMSEADKLSILNAGFIEFIKLGSTHMLSGYDHLLFLFGVIFFLTRFMDIVKFITAFTIGHSITLIFATIYSIQANYYLIDAVIALTVIYKGFENLNGFKKYFNYQPPNLIWMVFAFGLIHGFGLSTRLQQLPLGDDGLIGKIIAFNIGVEFGQIIALAIMLLLLSSWRHTTSFSHFTKAANVALIVIGSLLLLMQLHSYQHSAYADDFPLNKDDHHHTHQDMKNAQQPSVLDNVKKRFVMPATEPETKSVTEPTPEPKKKSHHHGDGKHHTH